MYNVRKKILHYVSLKYCSRPKKKKILMRFYSLFFLFLVLRFSLVFTILHIDLYLVEEPRQVYISCLRSYHVLDIQYSYENSIYVWDTVRGSDASGWRQETGSLNLKDRSNWTNKTKLRSRVWCCSAI